MPTEPIAPKHSDWIMVDYYIGEPDPIPGGWYGLKGGDRVTRGVPEGSRANWETLIEGLRGEAPEVYVHKRLAWSPEDGVYSPRNTNPGAFIFRGLSRSDLADLLQTLIAHAVEWTPDLPTPE